MKYFITVLILFSFSNNLFSKEVPPVLPVVDQAGLLSKKVQAQLTNALIQIKKQTGNEIALLIIPSLEGETIDGYSIKVTDKWKLGTKKDDNGILFLISVQDRKMRIEVGQGLEGDLPDARAGQIIRSIRPYFKKGEYQSGIILGISQIAKNIGVKLANAPRVRNRRSARSGSSLMLILFFIVPFFLRGRRRGSGGLMTGLLLGSMMSGGRSSGGSFGGGGGFGGGGASGGW